MSYNPNVPGRGWRFVVLHGFRKRTQKTPRREIATAERYLREFLARAGEQT
jgi:phage-related protein